MLIDWYVDVISAVLHMSFPGIVVVRNSLVRTDHAADAETEFFDRKKGGTYKNVPIYFRRLAQSGINEIHETFKTYQPKIYSSVCLLNTGYISADSLLP